MNINKKVNPNGYRALSDRAVKLERNGEYSAASDMWQRAQLVAKDIRNREWAKARKVWCRDKANKVLAAEVLAQSQAAPRGCK